ncbi:protein of unknown function [Blastococcus saxobsidens DD2]|uniref:Uncharacterized protein n=1 Tax=Blastococcus saxobsidens (strain DD2) TaxID=1146883 RepID=H6RNN5_BLASD|nr:protein of unknown function [Blastococcus saxobsidens DD2]
MKWNHAQPGSAAASRARHRAPEPEPDLDDVDELTDTVAISPLGLSYGQHAASTPGLPELRPRTGLRAAPLVDDAAAAESGADAIATGPRPATGRIARVLAGRLRPWQRSA